MVGRYTIDLPLSVQPSTTHHVQGQHQGQKQTVRHQAEKVIPQVLGFSPSNCSLQTLYGENEISSGTEQENGIGKLAGKYAKYAGEPPDGGLKAWSVILATCFLTCAAFGYVTSWGVFQAYYEEVLLHNESPSDIAWIGSVQLALIFLPGLVTGRLFDVGYFKIPCFLASCFLILCTFLVAECKVYWQFFLVQGLGVGLASGILFGPTLAIVPHWFSKRRGLAMGMSAIGSSIGGTVFPIAAQNLIPEVGFKWTMRIFAFMLTALLGVANLMVDRRLPPVNVHGGLFNWPALKNPAYAVYCVSGTITFLGMYTVLIYIPVSSSKAGVSNDFAFYLAAIANATSVVGRISTGFLADRAGALNVMIPFTIVVAVTTIMWPFMKSQGALIAIAVTYGFGYGAYISLVCMPIIAMGSTTDVGRRIGLFLSFTGFGALAGIPISGAINSATGGFEFVGWYAGRWNVVILSVLAAIVAASSPRQVEGQVLNGAWGIGLTLLFAYVLLWLYGMRATVEAKAVTPTRSTTATSKEDDKHASRDDNDCVRGSANISRIT